MYQNKGPRVRGLTARELFAKSRRKVIADIVQDQIRVIDAEISTNHTAGFNSIAHELPVNFNIGGMDKADAQTIVYSEILSTYKESEDKGGKGFDNVYIEPGERPKLYIYWVNGMDDDERRQRMEFIKSCCLPDNRKK